MQIYGPAQLHGPQSINAPHVSRNALGAAPQRSTAASDELQLSPQAQFASRLADIPDIRADRVQSIRTAIANGTYETSDKLSGALNNLLDEIG
jgi:flagellar biosynthesis anti-sigma factor FlgM